MTLQRRAALTLVLLASYALGAQLPLPGVDVEALGIQLSVLEFGIAPAVAAYLLVELAAAAIPRWRRLRVSGPGPRHKLVRAARLLTLVLAGFQAFGVAKMLEEAPLYSLGDPLSGASPIMPALTLVVGAGVTLTVAEALTRLRLVNGFVVLLLWATAKSLLGSRLASHASSSMPVASVVVFLLLPVIATWLCLSPDPRERASRELPRPASSFYPLTFAAAVLTGPVVLAEIPDALEMLGLPPDWWGANAWKTPTWLVALSCLFGAALGRAFSYPAEWPSALDRLSFEPARSQRLVRRAWRDALWGTLLYLMALAACEYGIRRLFGWQNLARDLALVTALGIDLRRTLGMQTTGTWVPVWREPRAHLVPLAAAYLEQQGIPARTGNWAQGVLLRFFGPYALPELLVQPENSERAAQLLAEFLPASFPALDQPLPEPNAESESEPAPAPVPASLTLRLAVLAGVAVFASWLL